MRRFIIHIMLSLCLFQTGNAIAQWNKKEKKIYDELIGSKAMMSGQSLHFNMTSYSTIKLTGKTKDSSYSTVECFVQGKRIYMRADGIEQMIDDSASLFIHHASRRMIYRQVTEAMRERYAEMMDLTRSGRKAEGEIASRYMIVKDGNKIILTDRLNLEGTQLSKEIITVEIDKRSGIPKHTTILRRQLVPANCEDSSRVVKGNVQWLSLPDEGCYYIAEHTTINDLTILATGDAVRMPASIPERLRRESEQYVPLPEYAGYQVINY